MHQPTDVFPAFVDKDVMLGRKAGIVLCCRRAGPTIRRMENPIIPLRAALESDARLRTEFLSAGSFDDAASIAARHGWIITAVDAEILAREWRGAAERELSDAELDRVSGGARINSGSVNPLTILRDRT